MMWLVAVAVLCASASQIVQVYAARGLPVGAGLVALLSQPLVLLAYLLLGLSLMCWLVALTQLELSRTYPLFALGYVSTMLFARFGLREVVPVKAWFGAALIVAGGALCVL